MSGVGLAWFCLRIWSNHVQNLMVNFGLVVNHIFNCPYEMRIFGGIPPVLDIPKF